MHRNSVKLFLLAILLVASCIIAFRAFGDLRVYHAVSVLAGQGLFSRIYGIPNDVGGYFYGPIGFLLFAPLKYFTIETTRIGWVALNVLAFVVFWRTLPKVFPALQTGPLWIWILTWIVAIKPIHASFQCHNLQLMYAALILVCYAWSKEESETKQFLGGMFLAIASVMKLYPLFIVAYFLLRARRTTKLGIAYGALIGLAAPLMVFGPHLGAQLYKKFALALPHFHAYASLTEDAVTLSLPSLVATWLSPLYGMENAIRLFTILGAVISIGFFYRSWQRKLPWGSESQAAEWALALAVMTLVNSTTRPDYFIYFVPAFTALAIYCSRLGRMPLWVGGGISVALISLISEWSLGSRALNHDLEHLRIPVLGMIALCTTLAVALHHVLIVKNSPQLQHQV